MGEVFGAENVLARVHLECFTGDVLGFPCAATAANNSMRLCAVLPPKVSRRHHLPPPEGRGIGLAQKLRASTTSRMKATIRLTPIYSSVIKQTNAKYSLLRQILSDLEVRSIRVSMTTILRQTGSSFQSWRDYLEGALLQPSVTAENGRTCAPRCSAHAAPPEPALVRQRCRTRTRRFSAAVQQLLEQLQERADAHFAAHHVPFVTISYAQSLDGSIANADGMPLRLSGPEAMRLTHAFARHA